MVKVSKDYPRRPDGSLNRDGWISAVSARCPHLSADRIAEALALVAARDAPDGASAAMGIEIATLLAELALDTDSVVAGLTYRALREQRLTIGEIERDLGADVARLITDVERMAATNVLSLSNAPLLEREARNQVDNVRRMLVALVDDVRVAIVKLAERIVTLRMLKSAPVERQRRVAREVLAVLAPLANRLGIWRLKWELEDLAFRYVDAVEYRRIAARLDGRRVQRERDIDVMVDAVSAALGQADIAAQVEGRAKHIYSIWRKMQEKGIAFSEVYDVRAVRVLVDDVKDCYAALGVVHTRWRHIPREFDDYVANPKENGYRSLHTAVVGPAGKTLEVQIRTHEMHREAELGVCAHWAYKGADDEGGSDDSYREKINWLRQVLEWHEELGGFVSVGEEIRANIEQERIYVTTPKGHVLDLVKGATPVDFAYRVHTQIGHRCRAARLDGERVALNTVLSTGQCVEITTSEEAEPRREWLNVNLGFVRTARARAKIQAFFRAQGREQTVAAGREQLRELFDRLGIALPRQADAHARGFESEEQLFYAVGIGELDAVAVLDTVEEDQAQLPLPGLSGSEAWVEGGGNLAIALAVCCRPGRDDAIVGHVLERRTMVVHQRDCQAFARLSGVDNDRVVALRWRDDRVPTTYRIEVRCIDRPGLLRDITMVLAERGVSLVGTRGSADADENTASIELDLRVTGLVALARILDHIRRIPNVFDARRTPVG